MARNGLYRWVFWLNWIGDESDIWYGIDAVVLDILQANPPCQVYNI